MRRPLVFLLLTIVACPLGAATRTWTGGSASSNLWSDASNWDGSVPVADDDLLFPESASRITGTNDLSPGTLFHSVTMLREYGFGGNSIALADGGLTIKIASVIQITPMPIAPTPLATLNLPITLAADQTWTIRAGTSIFFSNVALGGHALTITVGASSPGYPTPSVYFSGGISGSGNVTLNGSGWFSLSSANFTGTLTNNSVGVNLDGALAASYLQTGAARLNLSGNMSGATFQTGTFSPQ